MNKAPFWQKILPRQWRLLPIFPLLLWQSTPSFAHPHAFITMHTTPLLENNQLIGFKMNWQLDELSSAPILYDLQQGSAQQTLLDEAMNNIISEHFFSYLYDNKGEKIKYRATVANPELQQNQQQIAYQFDFLLATPQPLRQQKWQLQTYDASYYVAMRYPQNQENSFNFNTLPENCRGEIIEPNLNSELVAYAAALDKNQQSEDPSLGQAFAQKVVIECQ